MKKEPKIKPYKPEYVQIIEDENLHKPKDDYKISKEKEAKLPFWRRFLNIFKKKNKKIKKRTPKIIVKAYNPNIRKGLTSDEVQERKKAGLTNFVSSKSSKKLTTIIVQNLFSFFNIIMFIMVFALAYAKAKFSNYFFLFAVIANFLIYVIQEIKAKRIIDKLSLKSTSLVTVVRDSEEYEIRNDEIVYNDILFLKVGKKIPADMVLVSEDPIEVNESILTGEADSCIKKKGDTLYSGSYVVAGSCYAQAAVVGSDTYMEKLSSAAKKYVKPKSQIINSINLLIKILGFFVLVLGGLLFWLSTRGRVVGSSDYNAGIIQTVGALVGMIPAGLVVLTSMALAVGVVRLSQSNTMVQELSCIEMLARVDTLCLDKTGTITDGTMSVLEVVEFSNKKEDYKPDEILPAILKSLPPENATDKALFERFGDKVEWELVDRIPFSSKRKFSACEFRKQGTFLLGAPEFVLKNKYRLVAEKTEQAYRAGLRVLVLGKTKGKITKDKEFKSVDPVALIILEDRIRSDAPATIEYFKKAGVEVKVISGDNPVSVSRIAQKVQIEDAHKYVSLAGLNEEQVKELVNDYVVFGRVTPDQKRWLVQALKSSGRTIAMTGDGVNDLLALKEADTSIAMASGSEAARNISNLVLLDSKFSSMPKVVKEGRRVINNIKKVATIFVTKTVFSMLLTALTIVMQLIFGPGSFPYPIAPSQLLIIDWFIVGMPSFFLAMEQNNIKVKKSNFLRDVFKRALPGAISSVVSISLFYVIKDAVGISDKVSSTIIVYAALSIFMYVLFQNAKPFNLMRIFLVTIMYLAIIIGVLFTPELFGLSAVIPIGYAKNAPLNQTEILVLVIMVLLGYPIAYLVSNVGRWIKEISRKIKNKKSDKK